MLVQNTSVMTVVAALYVKWIVVCFLKQICKYFIQMLHFYSV